LKGEVKESPRHEFFYWSDDGDLMAMRFNQWKVTFKLQEHEGFEVWTKEFTNLRVPYLYNIRSDPFERGPESIEYEKWKFDHVFLLVPAQAMAAQWLASFKEFPPRQKPASFNLDQVMKDMSAQNAGSK